MCVDNDESPMSKALRVKRFQNWFSKYKIITLFHKYFMRLLIIVCHVEARADERHDAILIIVRRRRKQTWTSFSCWPETSSLNSFACNFTFHLVMKLFHLSLLIKNHQKQQFVRQKLINWIGGMGWREFLHGKARKGKSRDLLSAWLWNENEKA